MEPNGKPTLIPQPHGGALFAGGVKGNKGGHGVPSALRARMRGSLDERLRVAEEIADDPQATNGDRLRALEFLARYGLGLRHEVVGEVDVPEAPDLDELRRAIFNRLPRSAVASDDVRQSPGD